jgi:tetratricopeptide (TPR) repeat protein
MEKASMLNPRSQHIIFEIAITYIIVRQYFDAEGILSHAIEIAPYIDYLYTYKALLYRLWKGSPKLSREVLIEAASRIPAYNLVFSWIETDILERQYQEALSRLNPDYLTTPNADTVQFFLTRAYLYYLLNQPSPMKANADSGRLFNRYALESASENPYPHARLSFALALLGRKEEAPREAKRAVELLPIGKDAFNGPNYLENLMNIYIILGMYEEAITQLEYLLSIPSWISVQVVQLDPRFDPLRNNPRFQTILKKHNN